MLSLDTYSDIAAGPPPLALFAVPSWLSNGLAVAGRAFPVGTLTKWGVSLRRLVAARSSGAPATGLAARPGGPGIRDLTDVAAELGGRHVYSSLLPVSIAVGVFRYHYSA